MRLSTDRKRELQISTLLIAHYATVNWQSRYKIELLLDDKALPAGKAEEMFFVTDLALRLGKSAPFLRAYDIRFTFFGIELKVANRQLAHHN